MRTILVPLDGSPFSEHALPTAVDLAERSAITRLILGSVADTFVRGASTPLLVHRPQNHQRPEP